MSWLRRNLLDEYEVWALDDSDQMTWYSDRKRRRAAVRAARNLHAIGTKAVLVNQRTGKVG